MEVLLHSFLISTVVEVYGQLHAPASILPREESTVPIELDGSQLRSGLLEKKSLLPLRGCEPEILQLIAHSLPFTGSCL